MVTFGQIRNLVSASYFYVTVYHEGIVWAGSINDNFSSNYDDFEVFCIEGGENEHGDYLEITLKGVI